MVAGVAYACVFFRCEQAGVDVVGMTLAAKAALCVCPPAMIVGSVATLPVARQTVHAATAPAYKAINPAVAFRAMPLAPCVPVVESAQSLDSAAAPFRSVLKLEGSTPSI